MCDWLVAVFDMVRHGTQSVFVCDWLVAVFDRVDSQYTSQGKVGAAILVNHAAHEVMYQYLFVNWCVML